MWRDCQNGLWQGGGRPDVISALTEARSDTVDPREKKMYDGEILARGEVGEGGGGTEQAIPAGPRGKPGALGEVSKGKAMAAARPHTGTSGTKPNHEAPRSNHSFIWGTPQGALRMVRFHLGKRALAQWLSSSGATSPSMQHSKKEDVGGRPMAAKEESQGAC